jgi:glycosyltransferase involved in cell wall biosynthesis
MSVIRVGFVFEVLDSQWMGGLNYFINLVRAIHEMPSSRIKIVIFAGKNVNLYGMENYAQVVRSGILDKGTFARNFRKVTQIVLQKDLFLFSLVKKHKMDCLSHAENLWKGCSIPAIAWIADFQHKRLPQFFDRTEIKRRDKEHCKLLQPGNAILLSSHSAARDCERFYPGNGADINVLQFVSGAPPDWQPQPKIHLQERYVLPDGWLHVPNQFWAHKNHRVIINAMIILKQQGIKAVVVSTGNTVNCGNSEQFLMVSKLIEEYGLKDSFRILGPIPYDDMLSLMHHSIAVINPSLFEGWSTTVEEAKSMGKKILLSKIDVHIEQSPMRARYFVPHESAKLAELIERAINEFDPDEEERQIELSKQELKSRHLKFTQCYQEIIIRLTNKVAQHG